MKKRLAVLISGRGSNMEAILKACEQPDYPAEVVVVVSDNPVAGGLEAARSFRVKTVEAVDRSAFATKKDFEGQINQVLEDNHVDLICLAGFMRVLSTDFVQKWSGRLINIHPSLLPAFKGLDTHKRALETGVKWHGCSVHYVNAEVDSGAIIDQAVVPVLENDTEDTLAARVLTAEHPLYVQSIPKVLAMLAE